MKVKIDYACSPKLRKSIYECLGIEDFEYGTFFTVKNDVGETVHIIDYFIEEIINE
jgi:hypothetical protein